MSVDTGPEILQKTRYATATRKVMRREKNGQERSVRGLKEDLAREVRNRRRDFQPHTRRR